MRREGHEYFMFQGARVGYVRLCMDAAYDGETREEAAERLRIEGSMGCHKSCGETDIVWNHRGVEGLMDAAERDVDYFMEQLNLLWNGQ